MKKITCFILVFLLLHTILFYSVFAKETIIHNEEAEAENLSSIDTMTKGEAANLLYEILLEKGGKKNSRLRDIYQAATKERESLEVVPFVDLEESSPYYEALTVFYYYGVYNGTKVKGNYYANTEWILTREQAFVFIDNLCGFRGINPFSRFLFEDEAEISEFAWEAVGDLAELELISGTRIRPKEAMDQKEFLALVQKAMDSPRCSNRKRSGGRYYKSTILDKYLSKEVELVLNNKLVTSLDREIFFKFNNDTDTRFVRGSVASCFNLEKKIGDDWYVVPKRQYDIDDYGITIEAGQGRYHGNSIRLDRFFDNLEDGHYRAVFQITKDSSLTEPDYYEKQLCAKEFDIKIEKEKETEN